jgi:predicted Zn finger-like uncharacterized protein
MAKDLADQRGSRRYNVKDFELYCTPSGLLSFLGGPKGGGKLPVVNLSVGGAQFLSVKEFKNGEHVRIHLSGPLQSEPVDLEGEVCWCRQIPRRAAHRVGVRFVSGASRGKDRLQELEAKLGDLTIRLRCPGCGTAFTVKKRHEGEAGRCPRCKAVIEVRDEEALPELPEEKRVAAVEERPSQQVLTPAGISKGVVNFIRDTIPGRLHLDILQHFAKRPPGQLAGVSEMSLLVSMPEPRVHAAMRHLATRGILKELGAKTYNYDPGPDAKRRIAELATLMTNPAKRSEVLAVVLDAEKQSK